MRYLPFKLWNLYDAPQNLNSFYWLLVCGGLHGNLWLVDTVGNAEKKVPNKSKKNSVSVITRYTDIENIKPFCRAARFARSNLADLMNIRTVKPYRYNDVQITFLFENGLKQLKIKNTELE